MAWFKYLDPCVYFNNAKIEECNTHITIADQSYMERICRVHVWDTSKKSIPLPLPDSCHMTIFQECGPGKGTVYACKPDFSQGFVYRAFLGDMMYAYITCCPNTGYIITIMSKLSIKPS